LQRTHPLPLCIGFASKKVGLLVVLVVWLGLTCFEYFLGLTKAWYYNLKVPRGMERGKGKGGIIVGVLGKPSCFRSRSNMRLKD